MGVRGLTTYIAKNADRYLDAYELHNTNLIIDGDCVASNLYIWFSKCNSSYGGDYDQYYRLVEKFFQMLHECHVTPYVLMDGGYQFKKLRTVRDRLRGKIGLTKNFNPNDTKITLFPLMMREVFVEAATRCGVQVMRCIYESDDEVAIMAKKLNCPVLSYDSDFYIHNVQYIPLSTLTLKVYQKLQSTKGASSVRVNVAKAGKSRHRGVADEDTAAAKKNSKCYNYMDCCIYTIQNLAGRTLDENMLPLFATILGNDYIERRVLTKFRAQLSVKRVSRNVPKEQRRIVALLNWLKSEENLESAVRRVLVRMPNNKREWLLKKINIAMEGYRRQDSEAFAYFGFIENKEAVEDAPKGLQIDVNTIEDEPEEDNTLGEDYESEEDDENVEGNEEQVEELETKIEKEAIPEKSDEIEKRREDVDFKFPEWFKTKYEKAELPRYFVDLMYLRMYINAPQVEHFLFRDSNEIAMPILMLSFSLLNDPKTPTLGYLTRVVRITRVNQLEKQCKALEHEFNPLVQDTYFIHDLFKHMPNYKELFESLNYLPPHLRLYALSIVYWAVHSNHINTAHIHSVILTLLQLSVIDEYVHCPTRCEKMFKKAYSGAIKSVRSQEKNAKIQNSKGKNLNKNIIGESLPDEDLNDSEDDEFMTVGPSKSRPLPVETKQVQLTSSCYTDAIKRVTKTECILAEDVLLKNFHVEETTRRKHTTDTSAVIHGFAELQAVVFHLNSLNSLLNSPFQRLEVSKLIHGTFMYSSYLKLRDRTDFVHYVRVHLLRDAPNLMELYNILLEFLQRFVPSLNKEFKEKMKNKRKKNRQKEKRKLAADAGDDVGDEESKATFDEDNDSGTEFDDINNKFACLLKM